MKTYRLTREQFVPLAMDEVFAFFADAHNLERLMPPWLHFEILTPSPVEMGAGTLIDFKLRLHGIPVRWQSEIIVWQPPHRFLDRQVRGPYRLWIHTHTFERMGGGTLATDTVEYAVRGGDWVKRLFVRPDLERIFDFRARAMDAWVLETVRHRCTAEEADTDKTAAGQVIDDG